MACRYDASLIPVTPARQIPKQGPGSSGVKLESRAGGLRRLEDPKGVMVRSPPVSAVTIWRLNAEAWGLLGGCLGLPGGQSMTSLGLWWACSPGGPGPKNRKERALQLAVGDGVKLHRVVQVGGFSGSVIKAKTISGNSWGARSFPLGCKGASQLPARVQAACPWQGGPEHADRRLRSRPCTPRIIFSCGKKFERPNTPPRSGELFRIMGVACFAPGRVP